MIADSRYRQMFIVLDKRIDCSLRAGEFMKTVEVEHGLPFAPLLIGQWSTNANFQPAYDIATEYPNFFGGQPEYVVGVGASEQKIYINLTNNSGRKVDFCFRLLAMENPNYSEESTLVAADKTRFRFDSRWNYPKIVKSGVVWRSADIRHGLSYAPTARVWNEIDVVTQNGVARTLVSVGNRFNGIQLINGAVADSNKLMIRGEGKFYYVIFGEKA